MISRIIQTDVNVRQLKESSISFSEANLLQAIACLFVFSRAFSFKLLTALGLGHERVQ
jgi:hypothetical protein